MRLPKSIVLLLFFTSACASIINGARQDIGVSSSPTGADVTIDNAPSGKTPVVAKLTRRDNHIIKLELAGYQPYEITLTRSVSGWVWGNIVFGGLIGLAIDAVSGGLYYLSPEQVTTSLAKSETAKVTSSSSALTLAVVLKAEPGWVKIGQLKQL
jgi:hypothetical protein